MEQTISEIALSSSTTSQQSKEAETKKMPHVSGVESYPSDISSGNSICLEGNDTVQIVQETIPSQEGPRKKRQICPDDISSCNESRSGGDASQFAVSDGYTPASGSSSTLIEESLHTCQIEDNETIGMKFKNQFIFTEDDQKPKADVPCSSDGDLQNNSARNKLIASADVTLLSGSAESIKETSEHDFAKDGHQVDLLEEILCGESLSRVSNVTDIPSLVSAETSESTACCQEEKTSGISPLLDQSNMCSVQRNAEAAGHLKKKLLILDVNGLLADIVAYPAREYRPDAWISMKAVFKRPFCTDFLEFCFDNFEVGVWSSRNRKNVDSAVDFLMGDKKSKLLFCWDQSHCTDTGYKTVEDRNKPLFLKEIKKLWDKEDPDLPWKKGYYNESNTILMDDSPHKALRNPPYTGIFPYPYGYKDIRDNLLARKGKLRLYLERLVKADNIQKFVAENRFGQRPITKSSLSWAYYSKIFDAVGSSQREKKGVDMAGEAKTDDKQEPPPEASTSEVAATCAAKAEDVTGCPS